MEVRLLGPQDIDLVLSVGEGVFDNAVDPDQARAFLADPLHEIAAVLDSGRMVAFASGTVLLHPDKAPSMFVNEVGTHDAHRRRGFATAAMRALMARARERGCDGIWLGTEPDNAPALALYRKLAGDEQMIAGFAWDGAFDD